jgi:hypothetical protein
MIPKTAFVTGKRFVRASFTQISQDQSRLATSFSVIFGKASNILWHFVASFPLTYKTILDYAPIVKKQCLINFDASLPPKKKGYSLICNPLISMVGGTGIEPVTAAG